MADQQHDTDPLGDPLAGLTDDDADKAIGRFQAKVGQAEATLATAKAHLKAMKAARKHLTPPDPADPAGNGTSAHAEPATISVEAGER